MNSIEQVALQTGIGIPAVRATVALLTQGATVPFIARYRKAQTHGMDEDQIRIIQKRYQQIEELESRKQTILKTITELGLLTPELEAQIRACQDANVLEDLYLPYKPKRKTKASIALEQGLGPLAELIKTATTGDTDALVRQFINGEICTRKEAIQGAMYIIAEEVAENAAVRAHIRQTMQQSTAIGAKKKNNDHKEAFKFDTYDEFEVDILKIKPYQWLALCRGEDLGILQVKLEVDTLDLQAELNHRLGLSTDLLFLHEYQEAVKLSIQRYLTPSIEREIRKGLKETADLHAVQIFSQNLRNLLLQAPLADRVVMGIDPGFASGCKVAIVGKQGEYLAGDVIYPTEPHKRTNQAEAILCQLLAQFPVDIIAIGNGTASRETEMFIAQLIQKHKLKVQYLIVSEAGASVYSASDIARKEFPDLDAAQRGNISIARRIQDPLAELVKIDPQSLGVGLYQHDVDQSLLRSELTAVVESCVNEVGVDLNTASAALLTHVSGLNSRMADEIVRHRTQIGRFNRRQELLEVKGVGERTFEQAAGFLRIRNGTVPLDNTSIHPESYAKVGQLAQQLQVQPHEFGQLSKALLSLNKGQSETLLTAVELDPHTYQLIVQNLAKPGRDPREDVPPPILRTDVLSFQDLKEGMTLKGTVRNVVDFGAFVDIGLKQDALLHVSRMGKRKGVHPLTIVQVGEVIAVQVAQLDLEKERVGLALVNG
jgi:protein Tex